MWLAWAQYCSVVVQKNESSTRFEPQAAGIRGEEFHCGLTQPMDNSGESGLDSFLRVQLCKNSKKDSGACSVHIYFCLA
jgi:hypothetical protein